MVFNTFIKCQVCGCITRVRLQVGCQEEHPIEVACGKCGTSLSGSVKIGQDRPGLSFSLIMLMKFRAKMRITLLSVLVNFLP
ncbi:hypothetical protein ACLD53_00060 [Gardnerella swidsinskii]|uniref:hypothetical protein n=1 Tax=Gardnerella swidsinskii TaxID=2792979 RepID=UPI0039708BD3